MLIFLITLANKQTQRAQRITTTRGHIMACDDILAQLILVLTIWFIIRFGIKSGLIAFAGGSGIAKECVFLTHTDCLPCGVVIRTKHTHGGIQSILRPFLRIGIIAQHRAMINHCTHFKVLKWQLILLNW